MPLTASWTALNLAPAVSQTLTRSSHALIVHARKAYLFGGELKPRTPVDGILHALDLSSGQHNLIGPETQTAAVGPAPRVGTALAKVGDALYLWGGRGGKDMKPLSGELWKFDLGNPKDGRWEKLSTKGEQPEERSYHVLTGVSPVRSFSIFCIIYNFQTHSTAHPLPPRGLPPLRPSLNFTLPRPSYFDLAHSRIRSRTGTRRHRTRLHPNRRPLRLSRPLWRFRRPRARRPTGRLRHREECVDVRHSCGT